MRLAAIVALAYGFVPASGLNLFRGDSADQSLIGDDDLDVPGKSPLKFCDADRSTDIITIENVDLAPNPPLAGAELVITASGIVHEKIEEGAYVNIEVKYGLIRLLKTQADLCEQVKNVDLECPIEKGTLTLTKSVDLPKEIPPGKYTVQADVFTAEDKHVTCLKATVVFSVGDMIDL